MKGKRFLLCFLFLLFTFSVLNGQTNSSDASMISYQFDMSGFPQWAKDIRRGEIVAFGSFPFMYFFSNFAIDIYRCANNGWDRRYAPWPFDSAGSIGKDQDEKILTLGVAAGSAVAIALIDYGIERYKRSKREREIMELPEGTPIIIRRPLSGDDAASPDETPNAGADNNSHVPGNTASGGGSDNGRANPDAANGDIESSDYDVINPEL